MGLKDDIGDGALVYIKVECKHDGDRKHWQYTDVVTFDARKSTLLHTHT